jgi:hypothetical protein
LRLHLLRLDFLVFISPLPTYFYFPRNKLMDFLFVLAGDFVVQDNLRLINQNVDFLLFTSPGILTTLQIDDPKIFQQPVRETK